jgi:hypothetical protein
MSVEVSRLCHQHFKEFVMKPSIFVRGVFHSSYNNDSARNSGRAKLLSRGMVKRSDVEFKLYNPTTGDIK